jgi:hypothetical protein
MTKQDLARSIAALGLGAALIGWPAVASAAPRPVPAATTTDVGAPPSDVHERELRYAEREAASPRAADFKGNGVGVYIGGSTLAVVLIVVLIVVLL